MSLAQSIAKRRRRLREWWFMRRVVRAARRDPGFRFVQVGANDGVMGDPIRAYVVRERWHGVLVEPQQAVFQRLRENYAAESDRLTFVRTAIAEEDGTRTLWRLREARIDRNWKRGLGSLQRTRHLSDDADVESEEVPCTTWHGLLDRTGLERIDFLQMDVEGYDLRLLELFPWQRVTPRFVRFERAHFGPDEDRRARDLLEGLGYRLAELRHDYAAWRA